MNHMFFVGKQQTSWHWVGASLTCWKKSKDSRIMGIKRANLFFSLYSYGKEDSHFLNNFFFLSALLIHSLTLCFSPDLFWKLTPFFQPGQNIGKCIVSHFNIPDVGSHFLQKHGSLVFHTFFKGESPFRLQGKIRTVARHYSLHTVHDVVQLCINVLKKKTE